MVYLYKKAAQNRPGGFLALLCKARMNGILRFVPGGIGMKRLLCAYRNASLRVKLSLLVTAVLLTVLIACQVALYFYVAENVER